MIIDSETNHLLLADSLPKKQPAFCGDLFFILEEMRIPVNFIPLTRDIWARDFMPVQITRDKYVQFLYDPDYLREPRFASTRSDADVILQEMGITVVKSRLRVDCGNVVKGNDIVLMCDKVFRENPAIPKYELVSQLEELLEVNRIVFLPQDPKDIIGHADGMARFLDDDTILVNDYSTESLGYKNSVYGAIRAANLDYIPVAYNPYGNRGWLDASGVYINYLQMQQGIVLPVFGLIQDEDVLKQFERLFPRVTIKTVLSNKLAKEGGVLNCVGWNVSKP